MKAKVFKKIGNWKRVWYLGCDVCFVRKLLRRPLLGRRAPQAGPTETLLEGPGVSLYVIALLWKLQKKYLFIYFFKLLCGSPPFYGLINCRHTKAKCRYLKKGTCNGTLRQVSICLRPPPLLDFCEQFILYNPFPLCI
jgi:hypothetical protein